MQTSGPTQTRVGSAARGAGMGPKEQDLTSAQPAAQPPAPDPVAPTRAVADPSFFPAAQRAAEATPTSRPFLVSPDVPTGQDDLDRIEAAEFMAEVVAHRQVATPFCIGLFGSSGSGKSFFLDQMLAAVATASEGVARLAAGPFLPRILTVRVDAASMAEPGEALASAVLDALADRYPSLAADTRQSGTDPATAARAAGERLNEARRRLDEERDGRDAMESREARLAEAVLYDVPGSRIDAYARANRSRIERSLRAFGFNETDAVASYKDLVAEAAENHGAMARVGTVARAFVAYRGQTRLLVYAVLLAGIAWGAGALEADPASWLEMIRGAGSGMAPVADWAGAHLTWLGFIRTVATLLAVGAVVLNVGRAIRFLQPVFKGASLLGFDVEGRRRDLRGQIAHQNRRVNVLTTEMEAAAAAADEAERRAAARMAATPGAGPGRESREPAALFFADLGRAIAAIGPASDAAEAGGAKPAAAAAPGRIVVALDGLDAVASTKAADLVRAARRLLGPGFVTVVAADRTHLADGFGASDPALAAAQIARCVQLAYGVEPGSGAEAARSVLARKLMAGQPSAPRDSGIDAKRSALDAPWRAREAETVAALAPFAGESPRSVKAFVNTYRIARADPALREAAGPVFTALALALALKAHGFPDELAALETAIQGETPRDAALLRRALGAARTASGEPVELAQAQRALDVARRYAV